MHRQTGPEIDAYPVIKRAQRRRGDHWYEQGVNRCAGGHPEM